VFSGGPGCSSEIAIFYENGPYSINEDSATLTETKYGGQGCLLAAP
jgi:carboxypeptidase C (cathepsin A)